MAQAQAGQGTAPARAGSAAGEWEESALEITHGEASMIGARASFGIKLPKEMPSPRGQEGATVWEGTSRAGRILHVQVSLDRSPADLDAAAGLVSVGPDEQLEKSRTDDGYRIIATSAREARVFRTKSMNELSLVCEASIRSTGSAPLPDVARSAHWLDAVCGSVRPID
jgi:hypothetical protein